MTSFELPEEPTRPRAIAELPSAWRPLRALQQRMDDGIAAAYTTLGIEGVPTRFSAALMFLEDGAMSIRDLAERCGVTHSAMSQSVAAMRKSGLVASEPGEDARSRIISLTSRGREVAPQLWSEWYATERAVKEVADEVGVSLDDVVSSMSAALDREPFTDRLLRHMREHRA
ncbi:MarR family winged helix-turn-helix transcriptional regulator [Rathayibacter sp. CAU 1779]